MSCRRIQKAFGDRMVLSDIDLDITQGDRIALVGRNGAGKSTLANILTGSMDYDYGTIISSRQEFSIGYLRQTEAEPELFMKVLKMETEVNGEFQRLSSHLGINQLKNCSGERIQKLSGGEKTKIALARVWAAHPELLILDEPTNHMDYQGINFLISELSAYKGAAIIISHDRYFLDHTVSKIAELDNGKLKIYPGNYSAYREIRQKERESQWHRYESEQKVQKEIESKIQQLKGWSDKAHRESRRKAQGRMGAKEYYRKKAKKRDQAVKSQIKRLEKMRQEGTSRPEKEVQVSFGLKAWEQGGKRLLEGQDVGKSFGELLLFKDSSFYIKRGEKVGISGPNGCGKTTLVNIIVGRESLDAGNIFVSPSARIAFLSQDLPQGEINSVLDTLKAAKLEERKNTLQLLHNLGLAYDRMQLPMGKLSRGERMKIAMGMAIMGEYDLLIMDEPTNHLDVYSREALEESLIGFPGTILLISHDRYFLDRVCNVMLVFEGQKIKRVEGNLSDYLSAWSSPAAHSGSNKNDKREELLLVETQISRLLGEFHRYQVGESAYMDLDRKYQQLLQRKKELLNRE
ncbi:MAG: ribosomal protection-like ABC-F family protein [Syntrophomonadaceae bacterium]|nr:ABC-F family ATP-binding cassette domain-containing protein [Syntrophomonadaceae bacterium]